MKFRNQFMRYRMPMFEADGVGGAGGSDADNGGADGEEDTPTVEEVLTQLAQAKADYEKMKRNFDKASSEAADAKKQLRSRMTADEALAEEQRIAKEARDQEFADMKKQLAVINASKNFMGLKMNEEFATETAKAFVEGDNDLVMANLAKHIKAIEDSAIQAFLKDRPEIKMGHDSDAEDSAVALAKSLPKRQKAKVDSNSLSRFTL